MQKRIVTVLMIILAFFSLVILVLLRGAAGLVVRGGWRESGAVGSGGGEEVDKGDHGYRSDRGNRDGAIDFRDPLIDLVEPTAAYREDTPLEPMVRESDPVWGTGDVSIVLFCDHVSRACQEAVKAVQEVKEAQEGKARLIWKDFPSPLVAGAREAARAARCAQQQDKFWQYHDALQNPKYQIPDTGYYATVAQELGLEVDVFNRCVESGETVALVNRGMEEAQEMEVDAVPTVWVGKYRLRGEVRREGIEKLITLVSKVPQINNKSQFQISNVK